MVLRSFHYTIKETTLVSRAQNNERTIELRLEYAQKFLQLECEFFDENFVFLDEFKFQVVAHKKRARSLSETPACVVVPAMRS